MVHILRDIMKELRSCRNLSEQPNRLLYGEHFHNKVFIIYYMCYLLLRISDGVD